MHSKTRFARRLPAARATAVVALALFGCTISQTRKEEADATATAAYAHCDTLRRAGKYKTHLAAVDCAVPAVVEAYQESAYPFTDLVSIEIQARRIGASNIDSGKATEAEYQDDLAALDTRLAAEDQRRREIMTYGGRPQPVATETLVQGLPAFAVKPVAAEPPPMPAAGGCVPLTGIRSCK